MIVKGVDQPAVGRMVRFGDQSSEDLYFLFLEGRELRLPGIYIPKGSQT